MKTRTVLAGLLAVSCLWAVGCVGSVNSGSDSGVDSGGDAALDAGLDAGTDDSGPDAGDPLPDGADQIEDAGPDAGDQVSDGADEIEDAGQDAGDAGELDGTDGADAGGDSGPEYGAEFFVAPDGDDQDPGTLAQPFGTLERARAAVRELKATAGLPEGGVVVWLRGGVYQRTDTFTLTGQDSGEENRPVTYRGYPGEEARLVGALELDPAGFALVTDSSPLWNRIDPLARGQLWQTSLPAHGISDFGTLQPRGFYLDAKAALELFFDRVPMQLARWPDADVNQPPQTYEDEVIEIFGDPVPDVTGTWIADGTSDGVNRYSRQGLVTGLQYHLYRFNWDWQGNNYTAWFITTQDSGYPGDLDPWWNLYSPELGTFNSQTGAGGRPTVHDPQRINHGFVSIAQALSDTQFTYLGDRPDRWSQASGIWFHGFWEFMWADQHLRAASIDTASRTVTLEEAPWSGIETAQPYYVYNLIEEITQPGEWYLDRASGLLYFWPPRDLASGEIRVSQKEDRLLRLSETAWVVIQDLTLEMGRGELVWIEGGQHNLLLGCTIRNAGTDGVWVYGTANGLERCQVHNIGDRGVHLGGGDRASLTPANNYVKNCHIHHFGRWVWTYKPAVSISGCGQIVSHSWIHHAPHSAILYGGNENLIEYNDIHDVCRFTSDAGAIYAGRDWGYRGNIIRYNFLHHIDSFFEGYGVHGVYLDDCLSGVHVHGNLLYRISGHAIQHGGGRDDIMENNIMARCGDGLAADARGIQRINNTPGDSWNMLERLTNNGVLYQQDPWASRYPRLAAIPNDWATVSDPGALWLYPEGCVFSRNLGFLNGVWTKENNYGGTGTFNKFEEIADNIEDQDPLFVDEDNLDLNLQPGSPAYAIPGFQPIPFDQIGIQP